MSGLNFHIEDNISKNLDKMTQKVGAAVMMYAATQASQMRAYMITHHTWTNRTFMAEKTLDAIVSKPNENTIRITLAHGVQYGMWLELAHEKNFAIIQPTLNVYGPRVIEDMGNLMSSIVI